MRAIIDATRQDLSYAWRVVRRSPGFTFFATLTIALGLGANAAIFSLVDGVLLKSMSYPEPERIVQLWEKPPRGLRNGISAANYIDWTQQSQSFEAMAAQTGATMSYAASSATGSTGDEPRSLRVATVSAPYFEVFGTKAAHGRTFARDEDQPGREKVAVIGHRLWVNLFAADPSIVGRDILLNGEPYTVIGILPGNSEFNRRSSDLWIPLAFPAKVARDYHYLSAVARLEARCVLRTGAGRDERDRGRHRRALSRREEGLGRHRRSLHRQGRRSPDAVVAARADGGRGRRAADRMRQPGQPADGAGDAPLAGNRAASGAGCKSRAPGADAADREPDALGTRRPGRYRARLRTPAMDPEPAAAVLLSGGSKRRDGWPRARVSRHRHAVHERGLRIDAGAPRVAARRRRGAERRRTLELGGTP